MDKYTIQGQSLILGLMLAWILIIAAIHWTGDGFAMDGDQDEIVLLERE